MIFIPEANKIFQFTSFITGFFQGLIGLCMHFLIHLCPMIYSSHIRNSFFIYLRSYKWSNITLHIKYNTNIDLKYYVFGLLWFEHNFSSTQMRRLTNPALTRKYYTENIRFERMWLFKSNEFQAHRLKPLSQFSFSI